MTINRVCHQSATGGALATVLALVLVACGPATPPPPTLAPSAATEAPRPAAAVAPEPTAIPASRPVGKPEKPGVKLGIPGVSVGHLPFYLAAERTFKEEGLEVELLSFSGAPGVSQALAADSVDVGAGAVNSLVTMISAGQPVKGLYVGRYVADLEWFARPEIKNWADLRGKSVAITSYGSVTDFLTRHVLRKHGLEPERDVQLFQAGNSANATEALKAGRVQAAILLQPFTWQAEADGLTRLGTQAAEIADQWPNNLLIAKTQFVDEHPNTMRALVRGFVRAIRLAKTDREVAVQTIMKALTYERPYAERAYDEILPALDERGALPAKVMPVFWEIAVAAGEVSEPWPESRFFDRQFVDTFDEWAPR